MPDAPGGGEGSKKKTERDVSFKKKTHTKQTEE